MDLIVQDLQRFDDVDIQTIAQYFGIPKDINKYTLIKLVANSIYHKYYTKATFPGDYKSRDEIVQAIYSKEVSSAKGIQLLRKFDEQPIDDDDDKLPIDDGDDLLGSDAVVFRGEIIYSAIYRGISTDEKYLEQQVRKVIPSSEFLINNYKKWSSLPEEEIDVIDFYIDRGFKHMNNQLRKYPDIDAPINDIIDKMEPLRKNIQVFRLVENTNFVPSKPGEFKSYGYLSTSYDPTTYMISQCRSNKDKTEHIMRINVPAGRKFIWIPGLEYELIFKHGVSMRLNYKKETLLPCFLGVVPRNGEIYQYKKVMLYDVDILPI